MITKRGWTLKNPLPDLTPLLEKYGTIGGIPDEEWLAYCNALFTWNERNQVVEGDCAGSEDAR